MRPTCARARGQRALPTALTIAVGRSSSGVVYFLQPSICRGSRRRDMTLCPMDAPPPPYDKGSGGLLAQPVPAVCRVLQPLPFCIRVLPRLCSALALAAGCPCRCGRRLYVQSSQRPAPARRAARIAFVAVDATCTLPSCAHCILHLLLWTPPCTFAVLHALPSLLWTPHPRCTPSQAPNVVPPINAGTFQCVRCSQAIMAPWGQAWACPVCQVR